MFKKFIGKITIKIAKLYTKTRIARLFSKRHQPVVILPVAKTSKEVVDDIITESKLRMADAMAGRGEFASFTEAQRQAEFDAMFNRVVLLTEMRNIAKPMEEVYGLMNQLKN